jgi:hypothetical protein
VPGTATGTATAVGTSYRPAWRRARRWPLGRLAAVVAVGVAALLAQPVSGQEHGHGEGDGILPPGDWTEEQRHQLLDLIDRTEEALPANFADVETAVAAGFHDFGVTVGGYAHYINNAWIDDEHVLDPEHPESLVYRVNWDGSGESTYELVAAMFLLPSHHDMSTIPAELAWMPGWHTHEDVCVNDDLTYAGLSSGGTCFSGRPFARPPMMHAWITEYECDHRFGGIDVGGVHCDVHGGHNGPDPHGPDPHGPDPHQPDPHGPDPHATPSSTSTTHPAGHGGDDDGDGHGHGSPPPAHPVRGQPNYTG